MGIFGRKMNGLDRIGAEVEGGIRELVSRDVAEPRRQIADRSNGNDSESVINNLGLLLQRVSLNSVNEIDELIAELKMLREQLQHDGERMAREIVGYASLSQAAMQSTKILTDSLTSRKNES
jgi:type I site-specific restriction endonuclease